MNPIGILVLIVGLFLFWLYLLCERWRVDELQRQLKAERELIRIQGQWLHALGDIIQLAFPITPGNQDAKAAEYHQRQRHDEKQKQVEQEDKQS